MGKRLSTVEQHPLLPTINSMLDNGTPYREISAQTGLSVPAIGRHAISRKSTLAKLADSEPNVTDVVRRVIDAAEDARELRQYIRLTGTPVQRARAIRVELDALQKVIDALGVTDTDMGETVEQITNLVPVLVAHVVRDENSAALIERMAAVRGLEDLARAFQQQRDAR
jgi:hypothetical protein